MKRADPSKKNSTMYEKTWKIFVRTLWFSPTALRWVGLQIRAYNLLGKKPSASAAGSCHGTKAQETKLEAAQVFIAAVCVPICKYSKFTIILLRLSPFFLLFLILVKRVFYFL